MLTPGSRVGTALTCLRALGPARRGYEPAVPCLGLEASTPGGLARPDYVNGPIVLGPVVPCLNRARAGSGRIARLAIYTLEIPF